MRSLKVFAEEERFDLEERTILNKQGREKGKLKSVLKQCQEVISQLQKNNEKFEKDNDEKDSIIQKLIQQKQSFIVHMAVCGSDQLKNKLEQAQIRQNKMGDDFRVMGDRYQSIILKRNAQIDKLKGYNRALRIDNVHLREMQEQSDKRKRKVGMISQSCKKENEKVPFRKTMINSNYEQELRPTQIEPIYQTPQPLKSLKSAALPSTEYSASKTISINERQWKSKQVPKNLFSNPVLQQMRSQKQDFTCVSFSDHQKQLRISRVINRVKQLLAQSSQSEEDWL